MTASDDRLAAERYASRAEAIAAARLGLKPGECLRLHASTCAVRYRRDCNCEPEIVTADGIGSA